MYLVERETKVSKRAFRAARSAAWGLHAVPAARHRGVLLEILNIHWAVRLPLKVTRLQKEMFHGNTVSELSYEKKDLNTGDHTQTWPSVEKPKYFKPKEGSSVRRWVLAGNLPAALSSHSLWKACPSVGLGGRSCLQQTSRWWSDFTCFLAKK